MAAKSQKKITSKKNKKINILQDPRYRVSLAFFLAFVVVYFLISFTSYLFTWKTDNIEWIDVFSSSDLLVNNIGGKLGAFLAHTFIYDWFGIASFIIVGIIGIFALRLFKINIPNFSKIIKVSIVALFWLSLFFGLIDLLAVNKNFLFGGLQGLAMTKWLSAFMGTLGVSFLLLLSLIGIFIYGIPSVWSYLEQLIKPKAIEEDVMIEEETEDENKLSEEDPVLQDEQEIVVDFSEEEHEEIADDNQQQGQLSDEEDDELPEEQEEEDKEIISATDNEGEDTMTEQDAQDDEKQKEEFDVVDFEVEVAEEEETSEIIGPMPSEKYDPTLDLSFYKYPTLDMLKKYDNEGVDVQKDELEANKNKIEQTLLNYGIKIDKISAIVGPTITLYEIVPVAGVRISKIKNLEDDIALSLAALGIRIIAPIPGRGTIGIEVPNAKPQIVSMHSVIASKKFQEAEMALPVAIGKTISNETLVFDLAKMPHLLVAGATGQGKSVGLNAIITSLLFKKHPSQLKFVLIDPKKVEFSLYNKLQNHFIAIPEDADDFVITDVNKAVHTLLSLGREMDIRYDLLKKAFARNIVEYNEKFIDRKLNPQKGHRYLPYIVVIIDEFADLIMQVGKEVEMPVARIAQLARAVGIHMIVATQRPSTNVITGIIKANFPARIAFRVPSIVDSRTILDQTGANQLIGKGDLLISENGNVKRVQCAFVDTPEVERLVDYIYEQQGISPFLLPLPEDDKTSSVGGFGDGDDGYERDALFEDVARYVVENQHGSTSMIQRRFRIGYNRAGRIMDELEEAGIVSASDGSKARKVLVQDMVTLEQILKA